MVGFAGVVSGGCPVSNKDPGLTCEMSSFGSKGSVGGVGAARAPGMSTIPQPLALSKPGAPTSRAVERRICDSCETVSVGRSVHTQAAAADTSGAEKLV